LTRAGATDESLATFPALCHSLATAALRSPLVIPWARSKSSDTAHSPASTTAATACVTSALAFDSFFDRLALQ